MVLSPLCFLTSAFWLLLWKFVCLRWKFVCLTCSLYHYIIFNLAGILLLRTLPGQPGCPAPSLSRNSKPSSAYPRVISSTQKRSITQKNFCQRGDPWQKFPCCWILRPAVILQLYLKNIRWKRRQSTKRNWKNASAAPIILKTCPVSAWHTPSQMSAVSPI